MFANLGIIIMANQALEAKQLSDPKYDQLVEKLQERLNLTKERVESNIMLLASGQMV